MHLPVGDWAPVVRHTCPQFNATPSQYLASDGTPVGCCCSVMQPVVFAKENCNVEGQQTGLLDMLADVALHQEEFEEDECEEAPQEMEEDEKAPHDSQDPGET